MSVRQLIILIAGVAIASGGAKLRWEAENLALPTPAGAFGQLDNTLWSYRVQAFRDMSLVAMVAGAALVAGVLLQWCRPRTSS